MAARESIPIGKKFNSLTFMGDLQQTPEKRRMGLFRCVCGKERKMYIVNVKGGKSTSCGCRGENRNKRLDGADTVAHRRAHQIWVGMIRRCENPLCEDFHNYGGRGIKVCERWRNSFKNFVDDMGDPPDGMTIDRIDNDIGYEPMNCRWATRLEQNNNRRTTPMIEYCGRTQSISDWARELGVKYWSLRRRLVVFGWPVDKAMTTPFITGRNQYAE